MNTGDACIEYSHYKTQSKIVASSGVSVVIPCKSRIPDQYLVQNYIYWHKFNTSFEPILSTTYPRYYVHYYRELGYTYNTTDSSLTVHNATLLEAGCYRCLQFLCRKSIYDAVSITTNSGK